MKLFELDLKFFKKFVIMLSSEILNSVRHTL